MAPALVYAVFSLMPIICLSSKLTMSEHDTVGFQFYRQVVLHQRFTGLSIAEPINDASFRHFGFSLAAKMYDNYTSNAHSCRTDVSRRRYQMMRNKRNLGKLFQLC